VVQASDDENDASTWFKVGSKPCPIVVVVCFGMADETDETDGFFSQNFSGSGACCVPLRPVPSRKSLQKKSIISISSIRKPI
jgi:hypothetical protein